MARFGVSPTRNKQSDYAPARVTVAVLTFIPNLEGYYRHRMDVLRLCLESILRNTPRPFDLLVFDNGSCEPVVDYLRSLQQAGDIDILLLSAKNLGKIGALQVLFNAAPGELIAYCDDDILFYPGWLEAQLAVLEAYPNAGMVSGVPVRNAARLPSWANQAFIDSGPVDLHVSDQIQIPDEWEVDWAASTGRKPEQHLEESKDQKVLHLTYQGVSAYAVASHFQYMTPRQVILNALPDQWTGKLMGHMVELEEAIDTQGYLRLSTTQRYVRHIGNVVSPALAEEVKAFGIDVQGEVVTRRAKRHWILNIPRMRPLLEKIYGKLYDILMHVK
jgi:glycosyltransferase involved in cell wall biosynthesis